MSYNKDENKIKKKKWQIKFISFPDESEKIW